MPEDFQIFPAQKEDVKVRNSLSRSEGSVGWASSITILTLMRRGHVDVIAVTDLVQS